MRIKNYTQKEYKKENNPKMVECGLKTIGVNVNPEYGPSSTESTVLGSTTEKHSINL